MGEIVDTLNAMFPEPDMGGWKRYAFCPCGLASEPSFGKTFFIPYEVCPKCGRSKESARMATAQRVWVRNTTVKTVWWKPWTWNPGHWGWIIQNYLPFDEWDEPGFPGRELVKVVKGPDSK